MKLFSSLLSLASLASFALAETHYFKWNATYIEGSPDGIANVTDLIACNGVYPWPDVNVTKGDRVIVELYNGLGTANTSLHFHGLFQWQTNQMDGVPGLTQCDILPGQTFIYNFTIPDQVGTYWYHSHTKGQYMDGMRGSMIVVDPDDPYRDQYDDDFLVSIGEWYHDNITTLTDSFLDVYNPTGAEPIPQNLLFNGFMNGTLDIQEGLTYLIRLVNYGGFVSQYFWIEDHVLTVTAVDGVYVEPYECDKIYITVAQRYDFLVTAKTNVTRNYAMMQALDTDMLDTQPDDLQINVTNNFRYSEDFDDPDAFLYPGDFLDDFYLTPLDYYNTTEAFDHYDMQITIDVVMDNLGDGINYAFFNNITYVSPKVPALSTVMSAPNDTVALTSEVYGTNTHTYVLQPDDIIEIVLNNNDTGKHPFHMHGHVFQVIERGPDYGDSDDPIPYNESAPYEMPEYPMVRDTLYVRPYSYFVIRVRADNPGVWFFHCHIEWHLLQGLAMVLVEDPEGIRAGEMDFTDTYKSTCSACGGLTGNAANNSVNFYNLEGENVQVGPLPDGFTARGIVALVFSCIAGLLGCIAIGVYGMADIPNMEQKIVGDLSLEEKALYDEMDRQEGSGSGEGTNEGSSSGRYSDDATGKRYSDDVNTTSKRYSDDGNVVEETQTAVIEEKKP